MQSSITSLEDTAKSSGYTTNAYLRAIYGKGVNLKLFSDILYDQYLSTSYYNAKMADFTDRVD
jgi:hypothetical protein